MSMTDEVAQRRGDLRGADLSRIGGLSIRSQRAGTLHTIALEGELDIAHAAEFERELIRVEGTDASSIVVDLSGLGFIDSTGVRLVLQADARSRADANRLTLLRGPRAVQRVFELIGVTERLPFAD
jgi:anti-sigma B factor antagonist